MSDRRRAAAFVLIVSTAFILIGGIGLISQVTATSPINSTSISCGSAFSPDDIQAKNAAQEADLSLIRAGGSLSITRDSARDNVRVCADARSGRQAWMWPLFGLGLIGLLGWAFLRSSAPDRKPQGDASPA